MNESVAIGRGMVMPDAASHAGPVAPIPVPTRSMSRTWRIARSPLLLNRRLLVRRTIQLRKRGLASASSSSRLRSESFSLRSSEPLTPGNRIAFRRNLAPSRLKNLPWTPIGGIAARIELTYEVVS